MLQVQAYAPGFLLGLVTVAALAVKPAGGPEPGTGELAAIPGSQQDVDFPVANTTSTVSVDIPSSVVTINNGTSTRNVVVTFSADVHVSDAGDVFVLGFRVDAGSCSFQGPFLFTRSTVQDTRTVVHVLSIGPGTHTIKPCWHVAPDGDGAQFISVTTRSLIAEGRTR
jgi:hypothetical protein